MTALPLFTADLAVLIKTRLAQVGARGTPDRGGFEHLALLHHQLTPFSWK